MMSNVLIALREGCVLGCAGEACSVPLPGMSLGSFRYSHAAPYRSQFLQPGLRSSHWIPLDKFGLRSGTLDCYMDTDV